MPMRYIKVCCSNGGPQRDSRAVRWSSELRSWDLRESLTANHDAVPFALATGLLNPVAVTLQCSILPRASITEMHVLISYLYIHYRQDNACTAHRPARKRCFRIYSETHYFRIP
jgi:hypothetical protein